MPRDPRRLTYRPGCGHCDSHAIADWIAVLQIGTHSGRPKDEEYALCDTCAQLEFGTARLEAARAEYEREFETTIAVRPALVPVG